MNTKAKQSAPAPNNTLANFQLSVFSHNLLRKLVRRLIGHRGTANYRTTTEAQKNMTLTALVLGFFSIFAAAFPPCGVPIALTGFFLGIYGRRSTSFHMMSSWAIGLSFFGLILGVIYGTFMISTYVSRYILG